MTCKCHSYNLDPSNSEKMQEVMLDAPDWSSKKHICVDACISEVIKQVWSHGIVTMGCCCGHGKDNPSLIFEAKDPMDALDISKFIKNIDDRDWMLISVTDSSDKDARIKELEEQLAAKKQEQKETYAAYEEEYVSREMLAQKLAEATKTNPFDELAKRLRDDPDYAHSWHCNIAMMCYDAIMEFDSETLHEDAHKIGNDAASRFMKLCFNIVTEQPLPASDEVKE